MLILCVPGTKVGDGDSKYGQGSGFKNTNVNTVQFKIAERQTACADEGRTRCAGDSEAAAATGFFFTAAPAKAQSS